MAMIGNGPLWQSVLVALCLCWDATFGQTFSVTGVASNVTVTSTDRLYIARDSGHSSTVILSGSGFVDLIGAGAGCMFKGPVFDYVEGGTLEGDTLSCVLSSNTKITQLTDSTGWTVHIVVDPPGNGAVSPGLYPSTGFPVTVYSIAAFKLTSSSPDHGKTTETTSVTFSFLPGFVPPTSTRAHCLFAEIDCSVFGGGRSCDLTRAAATFGADTYSCTLPRIAAAATTPSSSKQFGLAISLSSERSEAVAFANRTAFTLFTYARPGPNIISTTFGGGGAFVVVSFDAPVEPRTSLCSDLWDAATILSFGNDAFCTWVTTQTTRIALGNGANVSTLTPKLVASFQTGLTGGVHRLNADFWLATSTSATIDTPEGQLFFGVPLTTPRLAISGPTTVSVCTTDDHVYSASWVIGLGFSPVQYLWTLSTQAGTILTSTSSGSSIFLVRGTTLAAASGPFFVNVSANVLDGFTFSSFSTIETVSGIFPSQAVLRMPKFVVFQSSDNIAIDASVSPPSCNVATWATQRLLDTLVAPDYAIEVNRSTTEMVLSTIGLALAEQASTLARDVVHTVVLRHIPTGTILDSAHLIVVAESVTVSVDGGTTRSFVPGTTQCLRPRLHGALPSTSTLFNWTCDLCAPTTAWTSQFNVNGGELCADFSSTTLVPATLSVQSIAPQSGTFGTVEIRDQTIFNDGDVHVTSYPSHLEGSSGEIATVYAIVDLTVVDQAVSSGSAVWTIRLANGTFVQITSVSSSIASYTIVRSGVLTSSNQIATGSSSVLRLDIALSSLEPGLVYTAELTVSVSRVLSGVSALAWAGTSVRAFEAPRVVSARGPIVITPTSGVGISTDFVVNAAGFVANGPTDYIFYARGASFGTLLLCTSSQNFCFVRLPTNTTDVGVRVVSVNHRMPSSTSWISVNLHPQTVLERQATLFAEIDLLLDEAQYSSAQNFLTLLSRLAPLAAELRLLEISSTAAAAKVGHLLSIVGPLSTGMRLAGVSLLHKVDLLISVTKNILQSARNSNLQDVSDLSMGTLAMHTAMQLLDSDVPTKDGSRDATQAAMNALAQATTLAGNPTRTQLSLVSSVVDDYARSAKLLAPIICATLPLGGSYSTSWGGNFTALEDSGGVIVTLPRAYPSRGLALSTVHARGMSIIITSAPFEADLNSNTACSTTGVLSSGCNNSCIFVVDSAFDTLTPSNESHLFSTTSPFSYKLISGIVQVGIRGRGAAHSASAMLALSFRNTVPTIGGTVDCYAWVESSREWVPALGSAISINRTASTVDCNVTGFGTYGVFELCPAGFLSLQCDTPCQPGTWGVGCVNSKACQQGVVVDKVTGLCPCPSGFTGDVCEFGCNSSSGAAYKGFLGFGLNCSHPRVCVAASTLSYSAHTGACTCVPGYIGADCSVDPPECASNPCENDGVCTENGVLDYTCTCVGGLNEFGQRVDHYSGKNCSVNVNDCSGTQCLNGAECTDCVGGFACAQPGVATPCSRAPFTTQTPDASSSPCSGGNFNCNPGLTGSFCQSYCPDNCFGLGCASLCSCNSGGVCDSITGSCTYPPVVADAIDDRWKLYVIVAMVFLIIILGILAVYCVTIQKQRRKSEALILRIRKSQTDSDRRGTSVPNSMLPKPVETSKSSFEVVEGVPFSHVERTEHPEPLSTPQKGDGSLVDAELTPKLQPGDVTNIHTEVHTPQSNTLTSDPVINGRDPHRECVGAGLAQKHNESTTNGVSAVEAPHKPSKEVLEDDSQISNVETSVSH
eukprot:m.7488 g.7488  ORF g.7488 m.7488 type:complete len:1747 (-) comp3964_c0_seq1:58-5298(-)